eukprot:scaffold931_cov383-Prasinococcus_capsulatus_cf.AAC.10
MALGPGARDLRPRSFSSAREMEIRRSWVHLLTYDVAQIGWAVCTKGPLKPAAHLTDGRG